MKESIAAAIRKRIAENTHYNSPNSVQRVFSLSAHLRDAFAHVAGVSHKKKQPIISAPVISRTNITDSTITATQIAPGTLSATQFQTASREPTLAQKYAHQMNVLGAAVDNIERVFNKPMAPFEIAAALMHLNVTANITLSHDKDYEVDARPHVLYVHALASIATQIANSDPKEQMLWRVMDAQKFNMHRVVAEDGEASAPPATDDNTLKITIDADSTKLVQRLYVDYVSETNMAKLPQFMIAFDRLLFKFRDGKPLTPEEIHEVNEVDQARAVKKKKAKKGKAKKPIEAPTEGEQPSQEEAPQEEDDAPLDLDDVEVASFKEATAASTDGQADKWLTSLFNLYEGNRFGLIFFLRAFGANAATQPQAWMDFWMNGIVRNPHTSFRPDAFEANGQLVLKNKNGIKVALRFPYDAATRVNGITLLSDNISQSPGKIGPVVLETDLNMKATRRLTSALEALDKMTFEQAQEFFVKRARGGE